MRGLPQQPVTDSATPEPTPNIPDHFALISPADQDTLTDPADVTLTWRSHSKAAWYRVRVEQMRQGKKPLIVVNHRLTTADLVTACVENVCTLDLATVGVTLKDGKRYKWQVIVKRAGNKKLHKTPKARFTIDTSQNEVEPTPEPTPTQTPNNLQLALQEDFEDLRYTDTWFESFSIELVDDNGDIALIGRLTSDLRPRYISFPREEIVIEAQVKVQYGTMRWITRLMNDSGYGLIVSTTGTIQLLRNGQIVEEVASEEDFYSQWQTLRLSLMGSEILVMLNGVPIITYVDPAPLPAGEFVIQGDAEYGSRYYLDDIYIWIAPEEIVSRDVAGHAALQLDTTSAAAGERIVTVVREGSHDKLYSSNLDGSDLHLIADGSKLNVPDSIEYVAVSPDGSKIAFGSYGIFIVNADGSADPWKLTTSIVGGSHPSWSPDGSKIVFANGGLFISDLYGNISTVIPNNSDFYFGTPKWSPDGSKIASYVSPVGWPTYGELWIVNADGTNPHKVNGDPIGATTGGKVQHGNYHWSPNGRYLVYQNVPPAGAGVPTDPISSIRLIDLNDHSVTQLTNEYRQDSQSTPVHIDNGFHGWLPPTDPWSPDSSTIYYQQNYRWMGFSSQTPHNDIFSVNVTGTGHTNLTDTPGRNTATDGEYRLDERLQSFSPNHSQGVYTSQKYGTGGAQSPTGAFLDLPALTGPAPLNGVYLSPDASFNIQGAQFVRPDFGTDVSLIGWKTIVVTQLAPPGCTVQIRDNNPDLEPGKQGVYGYEMALDALRIGAEGHITEITGSTDIGIIERSIIDRNVVKARRLEDGANPLEFWFYSGSGNAINTVEGNCNDVPVEMFNSSVLVAELETDYRVLLRYETGFEWTDTEIREIYAGVVSTAASFETLSDKGLTLPVLFRSVMTDDDVLPYIVVYKGVGTPDGPGPEVHQLSGMFDVPNPTGTGVLSISFDEEVTNGGCKTFQGTGTQAQPPDPKPRMIACNSLNIASEGGGLVLAGVKGLQSNLPFTQYLLVHELGHVFDNRTTLSNCTTTPTLSCRLLKQAFQGLSGGSCPAFLTDVLRPSPDATPPPNAPSLQFRTSCIDVVDADTRRVLGIYLDPNDPSTGGEHIRRDRGWGTGPHNIFTDFQQHPAGVEAFDEDSTELILEEEAADMFLNWVFRTLSNRPFTYLASFPGTWNGFRNQSWGTYGPNTYAGNDDLYPGDARLEWMHIVMQNIFDEKGW